MVKWEYRTVAFEFKQSWTGRRKIDMTAIDGQLSDLGNDGWELVSFVDTNSSLVQGPILFIFKRPQS